MAEVVVAKNYLTSKGFWGFVTTLAGLVLAKWGYKIDEALADEAAGLVVAGIGAALALWGRIVATRPLAFRRKRVTV